jgi:hypothetical protein
LLEGELVTMGPVFRNAGAEHYESRVRYAVGESVALEAFPDVQVEVARLF